MSHSLAAYLKSADLTQTELARRSRVARENINRVLNGKKTRFSVAEAGKLSAVTGISALELLGLPDHAVPKKTPARRAPPRSSRR